jgi:hypothetical protein
VPSLIKGRPNNTNNNNNKAKCIPGGTLRVLAGKKSDIADLCCLVVITDVLWFSVRCWSSVLKMTGSVLQLKSGQKMSRHSQSIS